MHGFLIAAALQAAGAAPTLYAGEARVRDLVSGQVQTEQVLLRRAVEPARRRIVETACVAHPGRPAIVSSVYMAVRGTRVSVSDGEAGAGSHVRGTGTVSGGAAWAWRQLRLDMVFKGPRGSIRIADVNYVFRGALIARKTLSIVEGPPVQLWEADLPETDAGRFRTAWHALHCPGDAPAT